MRVLRSNQDTNPWLILFVFRDHEKTLEEAEITATMKKILNGLTALGIELRS